MHVPYKDNNLTRLLQAYFEGRGMVRMAVNLNPDEVLKFSSKANQVKTNAFSI
jgi:hypothetical protein